VPGLQGFCTPESDPLCTLTLVPPGLRFVERCHAADAVGESVDSVLVRFARQVPSHQLALVGFECLVTLPCLALAQVTIFCLVINTIRCRDFSGLTQRAPSMSSGDQFLLVVSAAFTRCACLRRARDNILIWNRLLPAGFAATLKPLVTHPTQSVSPSGATGGNVLRVGTGESACGSQRNYLDDRLASRNLASTLHDYLQGLSAQFEGGLYIYGLFVSPPTHGAVLDYAQVTRTSPYNCYHTRFLPRLAVTSQLRGSVPAEEIVCSPPRSPRSACQAKKPSVPCLVDPILSHSIAVARQLRQKPEFSPSLELFGTRQHHLCIDKFSILPDIALVSPRRGFFFTLNSALPFSLVRN
jgi:hypothetical protein